MITSSYSKNNNKNKNQYLGKWQSFIILSKFLYTNSTKTFKSNTFYSLVRCIPSL